MGTKHEEENARFLRAAERMRTNSSLSLNNEQKLELYGYFKQVLFTLSETVGYVFFLIIPINIQKQATEGRCNIAKPGFFDFTGRAKWCVLKMKVYVVLKTKQKQNCNCAGKLGKN